MFGGIVRDSASLLFNQLKNGNIFKDIWQKAEESGRHGGLHDLDPRLL
jgi:hypothetical protein